MQSNKKIILIEDNPDDAELILHVLKKYSLSDKTVHLTNGEEALSYLLTDENEIFPQLILLDIKMPKVDGLTVLQKLKENNRTKTIPVVIFSSSSVEHDISNAFSKGANGYVIKPIDYEQFESSIKSIIDFWINVNVIYIK